MALLSLDRSGVFAEHHLEAGSFRERSFLYVPFCRAVALTPTKPPALWVDSVLYPDQAVTNS